MTASWLVKSVAGGLVLLAIPPLTQTALAQDAVAADTTVEGGCTQIHVRTQDAVSFSGSELAGQSDRIAIPVEFLSGPATQHSGTKAKITADNPAGLRSVSLARNSASSGEISITLAVAMNYRIIMDAETRHIRIDIGQVNSADVCNAGQTSVGSTTTQPAGPLAQANTAIAAGRFEEALKQLAPLIESLAGNDKQRAMELNGLALERLGRLSEAKVQYEDILALYPGHNSTDRIRQRLADVNDAMKAAPIDEEAKGDLPREFLTAPADRANESLADNSAALRGTIAPESTLRSLRKIKDPVLDPKDWTWSQYGSAGQAYYLVEELGDEKELLESEVISNVSADIKGENQMRAVSIRVDGLNRQNLGINDNGHRNSISTFYADILDKPSGYSARVGRQVRNDGGIFGRFDGVSLGWKANTQLDLMMAAGSPVHDRSALPFEDDRYFLSASGIYEFPDSAWSSELYAIEQRADGIVDRRAIGTEIRYESKDLAAYSGIDFDFNQRKVSSAFISTNWQASDKLVLSASLDYRTQPFLLTSNALSGQDQDKLPSLVNLVGEEQVLALANDRTADAVTAALGVSYTFSDTWQMSFDALWSDVSGMPASGGVDEVPELANDFYAAVYLNGTGILKDQDSVGLGLTYTHGEGRSKLGTDISWRFPVDDKLRLSTRLRASVTSGNGDATVSIAPSIGARYRIDKHWLLESELGVILRNGEMPAELQAFAGYRYEF